MKNKHSIYYLLWQQNTISNWPIYHTLYDRCHTELTTYCLSMLNNHKVARVIAYEAILELMSQLDDERVQNPDAWIINLAARKCQQRQAAA